MPSPITITVVGPTFLANFLHGDDETSPEEWEEDIRANPDVYYSDYLWLCNELHTQHLSRDGWRDLCRS